MRTPTAACDDEKLISVERVRPSGTEKVIHVLRTNAFASGSLSAVTTTVMLQPFDLVKTRLQSHATSHSGRKKIMTVISQVIRKESVAGLWKGTLPSLLRNVPGIGLYFWCLDFLSGGFCGDSPLSPLAALCVGTSARTFTVVVLLPMTLLKTKYESGLFRYSNLRQAVFHLYSHEGLNGLFRGTSATLLRDVPYSGMYLLFYSQSKLVVRSRDPIPTFACGIVSGLLASLITHPFDVIKTKMQLTSVNCGGLIRTSTSIFRQKGLSTFYSGMGPRIMRRSLMSALSWTIFESLAKNQ